MGKIKLNLISGSVIEKNLLTCFKSNNNVYMVLDNETTGSMGLPIILVSKIVDNKVVKIVDTTEWQLVKESLKSIIAGSITEYINPNPEMTAEDLFYSQLTLPVASFEALKNNYKPTVQMEVKPEISSINPTPVVNPTIEMPTVETMSAPVTPEVQPVVNPMPVVPDITVPPVSETFKPEVPPVVPTTPVAPVIPEVPQPFNEVKIDTIPKIEGQAPIVDTPILESPIIESVPEVNETVSQSGSINLDEMKETFMKSCENMFDALVSKMNLK